MKKLLLLFAFTAAMNVQAQSWAAPGATWHYTFGSGFGDGYERITKTGDTLINSNQYDVLQSFLKWHNLFNNMDDSANGNRFYTRAVNDIVYYYNLNDSAEYVLYDFNATAGSTWLGRSQFTLGLCDTGTIHTDSTGFVVINTDTLKVLYTSPAYNSNLSLQFFEPVIERIGGLDHLLPYPACVADLPQGWSFRCYTDSSGWFYQSSAWNYSCDGITGLRENNSRIRFSLYPNPAEDQLHFTIDSNGEETIFILSDLTGKTLHSFSSRASEGTISTQLLAPGLYCLKAVSSAGTSVQRFTVAGN